MTSARHTVNLLQLLARRGSPQPGAVIARDLGLPRSSTYRLLAVLRDAGFVTHDADDRRWGLGVAAYELGSAYTRQAPLQRIARPPLTRLVDRTGHSAHLAVLHGRDVLYVIEERAPGRPLLVTDVGVRLPATLTASGLAMLAQLPVAQVRALYPSRADFVVRHGVGPSSLTALRSELARVRQRGHATEDGSVTPGLASVAVAAFDHTGQPAAAVACTFPTDTVSASERTALVGEVAATAAEIGRRLGHRG
ncbi:IclR family transcriptional regulator [Calidifontibacter sp. DB0510]|uniref:IclR family transcriptional regulator n=1 Tax=Metallococcus carri TaxID=1656884 RepID=A0A967EB81_9MICO|nr:IclR family transcriptional regulator [Metallococcus carri]NHN57030.1 IclR family transcriptional regulator [Metallococcus carri]NOP39101.1 IclR family transcriptional regulator [Calidifontibacter sp. DB2511S]